MRGARGRAWGAALAVALPLLLACGPSFDADAPTRTEVLDAVLPDSQWVRLVTTLSEPGGYFDTDNLISNETGYLHVMGALERLEVRGGAYLGVGPDQNFSYMAEVRPELAFLIDIRRDNLLQHLLFRTLFEAADTRVEFLALLHGRSLPAQPDEWRSAGPDELVTYVMRAPGGPGTPSADSARETVTARLEAMPLALSDEDRATVARFHDAFIGAGPGLRFTSHGRPPRPHYPTYTELVTATDLSGEQASYLAREDDWRFVRDLHRANRVVPLVGDLAGEHALRALGEELRALGISVSAAYVSNVEYYLWRQGSARAFEANIAGLPATAEAVLVRSYFPNVGRRHPYAVRGSYSTQTLQSLADFQRVVASGGYESYWDAVTRDAIDPGR